MPCPQPTCDDAADANDDGLKNIADAIFILQNLFNNGRNPPPPFPDCGLDDTPDNLGCLSQPPCGG